MQGVGVARVTRGYELIVTGIAECDDCGRTWRACWPCGCGDLRCPDCLGTNTERKQTQPPELVVGADFIGLH